MEYLVQAYDTHHNWLDVDPRSEGYPTHVAGARELLEFVGRTKHGILHDFDAEISPERSSYPRTSAHRTTGSAPGRSASAARTTPQSGTSWRSTCKESSRKPERSRRSHWHAGTRSTTARAGRGRIHNVRPNRRVPELRHHGSAPRTGLQLRTDSHEDPRQWPVATEDPTR